MSVWARLFVMLSVGFLSGLGAGCWLPSAVVVRAYPGAPIPRSEAGVVRGWDTNFGHAGGMHVILQRVDGVRIGPDIFATEVELRPGFHVIEVGSFTSHTESVADLLIEIDVDAGKLYEIRAEHYHDELFSLSGKWRAWVVEVAAEDW